MPLFDRHALAAAGAVVAALAAAPLFAGPATGPVTATTASVTARAASVDPVAAPDQRWPVAGEAVQAAVRLADAHWGAPACAGTVTVTWTSLSPGTNATASWKNPTDAWNNAPANFDCAVDLNAGAQYDWEKLCTVIAHEVGHLHGRQHDEADDLMAAVYRRPLAACSATPEPGAPAPAPAPVAGDASFAPAVFAEDEDAFADEDAFTAPAEPVRSTPKRTSAAAKAAAKRTAAKRAAARKRAARAAARAKAARSARVRRLRAGASVQRGAVLTARYAIAR